MKTSGLVSSLNGRLGWSKARAICFDDESRTIFKDGLILDKTTWKSEHRWAL